MVGNSVTCRQLYKTKCIYKTSNFRCFKHKLSTHFTGKSINSTPTIKLIINYTAHGLVG